MTKDIPLSFCNLVPGSRVMVMHEPSGEIIANTNKQIEGHLLVMVPVRLDGQELLIRIRCAGFLSLRYTLLIQPPIPLFKINQPNDILDVSIVPRPAQ